MPTDREITDAELARAARDGSRAAFTDLVARYEHRLFRFLRMRSATVEDAEELLQEALLRSWTQLHRFDPTRVFSTWLYTLAGRLAASRARRRRLPVTDGAVDHLVCADDPFHIAERDEQRRNLWDVALRVLDARARAALWLFYAEDRSAREIGIILGKRDDAVRALLARARDRLASHLPSTTTCDGRP